MNTKNIRYIALDTETTGFGSSKNKIIEIAAVEFCPKTGATNGKNFHTFLDPGMPVHWAATEVHGKTWDDLKGEPNFSQVADEFLRFIEGSHLVIHNAPFDVDFLNEELSRINTKPISHSVSEITDTLSLSRKHLVKGKHKLDNLADLFGVDRTNRKKHGALIDCEILAQIYPHLMRLSSPLKSPLTLMTTVSSVSSVS